MFVGLLRWTYYLIQLCYLWWFIGADVAGVAGVTGVAGVVVGHYLAWFIVILFSSFIYWIIYSFYFNLIIFSSIFNCYLYTSSIIWLFAVSLASSHLPPTSLPPPSHLPSPSPLSADPFITDWERYALKISKFSAIYANLCKWGLIMLIYANQGAVSVDLAVGGGRVGRRGER